MTRHDWLNGIASLIITASGIFNLIAITYIQRNMKRINKAQKELAQEHKEGFQLAIRIAHLAHARITFLRRQFETTGSLNEESDAKNTLD